MRNSIQTPLNTYEVEYSYISDRPIGRVTGTRRIDRRSAQAAADAVRKESRFETYTIHAVKLVCEDWK